MRNVAIGGQDRRIVGELDGPTRNRQRHGSVPDRYATAERPNTTKKATLNGSLRHADDLGHVCPKVISYRSEAVAQAVFCGEALTETLRWRTFVAASQEKRNAYLTAKKLMGEQQCTNLFRSQGLRQSQS
jgi:hypothetical protein